MSMIHHYQQHLEQLQQRQQRRRIPSLIHRGAKVINEEQTLINISCNDYLGMASDRHLQDEFLMYMRDAQDLDDFRFSSSSSRLLTGNHIQLEQLEAELEAWYRAAVTSTSLLTSSESSTEVLPDLSSKRAMQHSKVESSTLEYSALVFNSGYHANVGLLPALTKLPLKTLILSDQLVHASIIDGVRLSRCDYRIYRHNDHEHLRQLLGDVDDSYQRIIIVTESLFSMDGDYADLRDLVAIKQQDDRIELYVDEAHAIGVVGQTGLGLAELTHTLSDIDYLVGTFGKAFASMGAYIFCHTTIKHWLINTMRPLIFSTALPPINHAWTRFILAKMPDYGAQRQRLAAMSANLRHTIAQISPASAVSDSHIVPYILGSNAAALAKAAELRQAGFYALPIRPPTVPKDTARIRLIINAAITDEAYEKLLATLD